jgi:hypothetical protein
LLLRRLGINYAINVKTNKPLQPHIYSLTRQETKAVKAYINEIIGKSFIQPSTLLYASPVLVVKKPEGRLRICVNYRGLNTVTKKN